MSHVDQVLLTLQEHLSSSTIFREVRVSRTLVFCLVCCRSLFVLLSFFVWTLYYLSFNLRILITPLVSSTLPCLSSLIRILRLSFVFMFILLLICLDWAEYVKMFILKVMEAFNVYGWQTTFLDIFICSKSI